MTYATITTVMSLNQNQNLLLDDQWLKVATFWTTYRGRIRTVIIAIIVFIEAVFLLYSLVLAFDIFILSAKKDAQVLNELTTFKNYAAFHPLISPEPLVIPAAVVLPESANNNSYDVLLRLSNPNEKWMADVMIEAAGKQTNVRVLNNQERLVVLNGGAVSLSSASDIKIIDINWHRIKNVAALNSKKPNLVIENVAYNNSTDVRPNQVEFSIQNDSVYNFWEISATVVLMQGSRAVAARQIQLSQLLKGEQRDISVNFFGPVGNVTDVLIVPFADVSDSGVFMNLDSPSQPF